MHVIDSHTGGEPTRVIVNGGPDLGSGTLAERAQCLANNHQLFCKSVLLEPRGQPGMVGALLVKAENPECQMGVIYFDANEVLGMCGHSTIGVAVTLAYMGRISTGKSLIETPVGTVEVKLHDSNKVTIFNVESYCYAKSIVVEVNSNKSVIGDVAYGGNWFFIINPSPIPVEATNIRQLTDMAIVIRGKLKANKITGKQSAPINHIIFQEELATKYSHGRNFVLCPDDAYDRSPCGTGCSAIIACLVAEDRLSVGEEIVQESIIESSYRLSYTPSTNGNVLPIITGQAWIMSEGKLIFSEDDPYCYGI